MEDKLLFTDDNFELVPAEGEIWPGATVAITVIFRPTEPKQYRQVSRDEVLVVLMKPCIVMLMHAFVFYTCVQLILRLFFRFIAVNQLPIKDLQWIFSMPITVPDVQNLTKFIC